MASLVLAATMAYCSLFNIATIILRPDKYNTTINRIEGFAPMKHISKKPLQNVLSGLTARVGVLCDADLMPFFSIDRSDGQAYFTRT